MNARIGCLLAAAALAAGWVGFGGRGIVLALTAIAFWLLLQFGRAMRVMRRAARAPLGHVPSAVMLHARLRRGMTMLELVSITGSLGEAAASERPSSAYCWRDAGGSALRVSFARDRVSTWAIERADEA